MNIVHNQYEYYHLKIFYYRIKILEKIHQLFSQIFHRENQLKMSQDVEQQILNYCHMKMN